MFDLFANNPAPGQTNLAFPVSLTERYRPGAARPNFQRIIKESNNNIREALNKLETELMLAA
jgi:hypothetical protein